MPSPTPVLLLAHGSPDPDWRRPIEQLAATLRERRPQQVVRETYLGHLSPSLAEAVEQLAAEGHASARVLPVFLSPGGRHIKRDIPELVAEVAAQFPAVTLTLQPGALGAEPEVVEALAQVAARVLDEDQPES